jgi:putative FmdB family regulatory protein
VPTYEYECWGCHRAFEVRQRISEAPLTVCEACGGEVRRLLSAAPFILKGEGWYVTDYPSAARKKAIESEKGGTESKPSGDKPSESKPSGEKSSGEQSSTPAAPSTTAATSTPAPTGSSKTPSSTE